MRLAQIQKARIWPQKHRSGNVTWKVQIGKKNDGKADIRSFARENEAKQFQLEWNSKLVAKKKDFLTDLNQVARTEILAALAKLEANGATINEAVDFFLKFARPAKGQITITEAINIFLKAKAGVGRSPIYIRNCKMTFFQPFQRGFPSKTLVNEITSADAKKYIYSHKHWSPTTVTSHINYLTTLYHFLIKNHYANLNPFRTLDKPARVVIKAKTLSPEEVRQLLQYALANGKRAECACMTLVFFCGVRVQEVGRLEWKRVDLKHRRVTVELEEAKKRRRRVNVISPNAVEWLKLCQSDGRIAPNNYNQQMKRLRRRAKIHYVQNAMRHCFSAYHLAACGDANKTAFMLGHTNAQLLYQTYYASVNPDDVARYWDIIPDSVIAERKAENQKSDAKDKEYAESLSNIGQAIKGDDGSWHPIMGEQETNFGDSF